MFNFLKEKLKNAVSAFTKKVENEVDEPPITNKKSEEKNEEKQQPTKKEKTLLKKEEKKKTKETSTKKKSQEEIHLPLEEEADVEPIIDESPKPIQEVSSQKKTDDKDEKTQTGFFKKIGGFFTKKSDDTKQEQQPLNPEQEKSSQKSANTKQEQSEGKEQKETKGFFSSLTDAFTKKTLSNEKFEELFADLEIALLENNVALEVIEKIKKDLQEQLVNQKIKRGSLDEVIVATLRESLDAVLSQQPLDLLAAVSEKKEKPLVICFFGINGSGKTTTIAKLAQYFKKNNQTVVLAAADTFRAAAIDQLQTHADNLHVKIIKQAYGSDAAAVAFDAIHYGKAHHADVVLIDTAGRSHTNANLMDELKKIMRVAKPDLKIFIGDSLTGNDMVDQAQKYADTVGIDGIILAKADADEKGGATISAAYVTKKPILFLGVGQTYDDLQPFVKEKILENLGLS